MKRLLIIEDSPEVLKYLLDVFYPRWSPFSVDYQVTITTSGGEASGEVLQYALTVGLIRPGTKVIAISGIPTNNVRLLELGAHVALDKNSLRFYEQVRQLVS